jgi:hypothetical protein
VKIKPLPFDFYLPSHNLCIEFNGKQHYEHNHFFVTEKGFEELKERDEKYLESDKKADLFLNFLKGSQDEKELKKLKEGLSKHRNFFGFGKTESLKILKNESSELYQKLKKNNKKLH